MDNYCARPENFLASELSIASLDTDSIPGSNRIESPSPNQETAESSLPELELVDGQSSQTELLKICLNKEAVNPKPFAALSSVSLADCDPEFKILVKDLQKTCSPADQAKRTESAQKLLKIAREDDKYRKVLEPFMNDLFNEAYPFPKMTEKN